jgi:Mrp family chromosome partitioning ATPase
MPTVMPPVAPIPPPPQILSPPLSPAAGQAPDRTAAPLVASTVERFARELRQASPGGVIVVGTVRNVGTTYAAIMLARALAHEANVVLVDLAFSSPNLSVISTEPNAPGIAELVRGTASFGDVITRDQYSRVHLVAAGNVGSDVATLASSPMLATVIEALSHSYEHVVIDMGSASDVAAERFVLLATHAMLVAADPASTVTRTVRDRLLQAGFGDVAVIAGGAQAVAA